MLNMIIRNINPCKSIVHFIVIIVVLIVSCAAVSLNSEKIDSENLQNEKYQSLVQNNIISESNDLKSNLVKRKVTKLFPIVYYIKNKLHQLEAPVSKIAERNKAFVSNNKFENVDHLDDMINRLKRNAIFEEDAPKKEISMKPKLAKITKSSKDKSYVLKRKPEEKQQLLTVEKIENNTSNKFKREIFSSKQDKRANTNDFYIQRKAIMDRFHARMQEITAKYAKENTTMPTITFKTEIKPRNATLNESQMSKINFNFTDSKTNLIRNTLFDDVDIGPGYDKTISESNNVLREQSNYNGVKGREDNRRNVIDNQRIGECSGYVIYEHNLALGLYHHNSEGTTGFSSLDVTFEVIFEGSVCLTCLDIIKYNSTEAIVSLIAGGQNHKFVKLRLTGSKNQGLYYIIRILGIDEDC